MRGEVPPNFARLIFLRQMEIFFRQLILFSKDFSNITIFLRATDFRNETVRFFSLRFLWNYVILETIKGGEDMSNISLEQLTKLGVGLGFMYRYGSKGYRLKPGAKSRLGIGLEFTNVLSQKVRRKLSEEQINVDTGLIAQRMFKVAIDDINAKAATVSAFGATLPGGQGANVSWKISQRDTEAVLRKTPKGLDLFANLATIQRKQASAEAAMKRMQKEQKEIAGGIKRLKINGKLYDVRSVVYSDNPVFRAGGAFTKEHRVLGAVSNLYNAARNSSDPYWQRFALEISKMNPSDVFRIWQKAAQNTPDGQSDPFEIVFQYRSLVNPNSSEAKRALSYIGINTEEED